MGRIPADWKTAHVTAIFKKGTKSTAGNYRPVSLTCVLCKVLESIIRDAMVNHMNDHKLYSSCQHGFRKGRSCTTQLLEVMENLSRSIDDGQNIDILYLDFRKAFDQVPHHRLLLKLRSYGFVGNISKWIEDFLSDRTQKVIQLMLRYLAGSHKVVYWDQSYLQYISMTYHMAYPVLAKILQMIPKSLILQITIGSFNRIWNYYKHGQISGCYISMQKNAKYYMLVELTNAINTAWK